MFLQKKSNSSGVWYLGMWYLGGGGTSFDEQSENTVLASSQLLKAQG